MYLVEILYALNWMFGLFYSLSTAYGLITVSIAMLPKRRSYSCIFIPIDTFEYDVHACVYLCFCAGLCERLDVAGEHCSLPCMYWLSMIKQNNKSRKSSVMNRIFRSEIKWKAAQSELRNTTEIYAKVLAMWKLVSRLLFVISQLNNRRSAYYKHIRIQKKNSQPCSSYVCHQSVES